ncbi:S8 family peptidase [Microbacterium sp. 179-I 3D3 NHS]|uniref:S8 family peptidase n=1 Tax=Microbacterium sp. 179-I 3D3 NHS TaxID=3142382 RepID=UPI00399EEE72
MGGILACAALMLTPSFAGATTGATTDVPDDAQIIGAGSAGAVADEYIVVLEPQSAIGAAQDIASALTEAVGGELLDVFNTAIDGYSATLTEDEALAIAADPRVSSVEQVQRVHALAEQVSPPDWGADRIDQRDLPLNQRFAYPDSAGEGVNVYVVDSGIRRTHAEFAGRIRPGFDALTTGGDASDCNGHGTHVAGTAVGSTYGIAKKATVYPVKILDCRGDGDTTGILRAVEWISENAQKPAVVNYSVGCRSACSSPALDQAVKNLVASGVSWVQAAGNSNDDACRYSPQLVPEAVTVGNTTRTDQKNASSSWGRCLDIWAPGTEITSSWFTGDTAAATATGTSMASPHVAGATALYLAANPSATPAQVHAALVDNATPNRIGGLDAASPNRLLFTGFLNGPTTPTPTAVDLAAVADQSGTVGTAVDLTVTASGGTKPYAFSASSLPAGVALDAGTGRITGTPTTAGSFTVTVTVRDSASPATTDTVTFTWRVAAAPTTPPSTCTGTPVSTGTLTVGQQATSPTFSRTASGTIQVCLDGPTGADFDVYLQRNYSFLGWITVAQGTSTRPDEQLSHSASSGTYRVVVRADSGSGPYTATVR